MSKQLIFGLVVAALTSVNVLTLVMNLSLPSKAEVAGMDYRALYKDQDFRRAVARVVEDCRAPGGGPILC